MVIEALAASEAALRLEARELAADLQTYRELSQEALHKLADLTRKLAHANATIHALREELRRYTAGAALGRAA
jgi:uncharacterized coiled-coil DUF342 family protein